MTENREVLLYLLRIAGFLFAVCCVWMIFARQKKKMRRLKAANKYSAVVLLHKRHAGNMDYSSINAILHIDGLHAETFLYALGGPCGVSLSRKTCHRGGGSLVEAYPRAAHERVSGRSRYDDRLRRVRRILVAGVLHF